MVSLPLKNRSIYSTIVIPMIVLLLLEVAIFSGILIVSGTLPRLEQNDRDILNQQVLSRRDSLQNYLVDTVGDLQALADFTNQTTTEMLKENQLKLSDFSNGAAATTQLQERLVPAMVQALRAKQASGVFVLFNTEDLSLAHESGAYGSKPGIYIRDMDPASTPSARNDDLTIEVGSREVVQSSRITSDSQWQTMFDLDAFAGTNSYEFIYRTFQFAYRAEGEKVASDYAYWGVSPKIDSASGECNVVYSIPLILEDGMVYGIVGVDLSSDYLSSLLPSRELLNNQGASYVLAQIPSQDIEMAAGGAMQANPVLISGNAIPGISWGTPITLEGRSSHGFEYASDQNYYVSSANLRLYNTNSPVEDSQWVLMGVIPSATLHQFASHIRWMIVLASGLMLLVGVLGALVVGRSIARPVRNLSQEVARAQLSEKDVGMPQLSQTGIEEIDQLTGAITTLSRDIASVKLLEQQRMEYERDYDLLTGLMNRRAFYREVNKVFSVPSRLKEAAIVMLDIDNLKDVNDTYGHDWGDKYVHAAARCFEEGAPPNAIMSRVSGDEFYVFLYGFDTREDLEEQIEQLQQFIHESVFTFPDGRRGAIHASGGVALYLQDAEEFAELMRLADFTMYQVKKTGKDSIAYFDLETYQRETNALRAAADLNSLLADYSLANYFFQPIFDARTGKPYAYEALMRVNMEVLQSPTDVLTYARQEKRLMEVERLTWTRAFECYRKLYEEGNVDPDAYLFLNTFANVSLGKDELESFARKNQDIMPRLVIEVTEAETMDEEATAIKRSLPGFSGMIALDDYGSGYNSEVMLIELKPKFVKVDISIVRGIDASADKQRVMSHVVDYAHERDMLIVAEGVETAEELECVLALGVDLLQGYYLARPSAIPGTLSSDARSHLFSSR